ncbi:MAG: hypothetical protein WCJ30_04470 [Deltaproteobacteria bacterium]
MFAKPPPARRARFTPPRAGFLAVFLATLVCAPVAQADPGADIPVDGVRPPSMPGILRGWPLAVHGAPGTPADTMTDTLAAARSALDALRTRFVLPDPAPDGTRGGGPELDVYVLPPGAPDAPPSDAVFDTLEHAATWDRATSFITLRGDLAPAARETALTEALVRALMLSIDARSPRVWQLAVSSTYAQRVGDGGIPHAALAAFQATADGALLRDRDDDSARGAALFTNFLAERFDTPDLRGLRGLLWMAASHTAPERDHFVPAPHVFDVMARTLRGERGGFDGAMADFALARGLLGTTADTLGHPGVGPDPEDLSLRPQPWFEARFAALPAWITPARPLDETGSAYVAVDTRGAVAGRSVTVFFHGVPWCSWLVTVARYASDGTFAGLVPRSPVVDGEWHAAVENLDRVARLLVVVTNMGNGNLDPHEPPNRNGFFAVHVTGP